MRTLLRCLAALALVPAAAPVGAADPAHSFEVAVKARLDMDAAGKTQKVEADTALRYTWARPPGERTLTFDSVRLRATLDGRPTADTFMSRDKLTNTEGGQTREVPADSAPDELKTMLRDSFGVPVAKVKVDADGKEVKREVVAGPGAKTLVDQGMIANALLFHPPYPKGRDEWTAPAEVSMGNGGFAKGDLTYKKAAGGKGGQRVKVSGTLANDGFQAPGSPLTLKNARYVVTGEQTYDPDRGEWVAGRLNLDVSFQLAAKDKVVIAAKGTMDVSLELVPAKK